MKPMASPGFLRSALRFLAPALACSTFAAGLLAAPDPAAPPQMAPSAAIQMEALKSIKRTSTPLQRKIDSRLYLGVLHRRNDARLASLSSFRFVKPEADGRVPVDVVLDGVAEIKNVLNTIEALGGVVQGKSSTYLTVRARVHLEDLEAVAALRHVKRVRQAMPVYTHALNVSEGDLTHGAAEARGFFGTTGAGVKVGVISDGVDTLAAVQASGDLPPVVEVLPGQAGSGDEGTAMLEIVHDLAPGAALAFATGTLNEVQFAQNILDLAADGCNVIVDDLLYLDESPFQDGLVAQAVNTVTGNGVLYFSAAGNEGNVDDGTSGTWEGDFLASSAPDPIPLNGSNLHDFGDGGNSILVEFGGGNPPLLIWAEHYDLYTGIASTDFDLYDMDGGLTTILDASTDVQDGTGGDDFPIEFIGGGTFGGERLLIDKFASGTTTSVPEMNLIVFFGELDNNLATRGSTRGHSSAVAAFSIAATPAAASSDGITPDGPYPDPFNSTNETESFTADGPRRILLNTDGSEITPGNRTSTGGVVRQKPDFTAADGVSCAAAGFATFYGTSAAAPHAAAIGALLKSAVPGITPDQVRTALLASAIDIEAAGVDPDTGAGIIMAHAALEAAGAQPMAFLSAGTAVPTEFFGDGDPYVEPNEIWTLSIPLTNVGALTATGIGAVLSTATSGVAITSASSSYSDLAVAASGSNTTPFRFQLAPDFPCAGLIDFALDVTYGGGPPQTFHLTVLAGSPGTPVTFTYAGAPVPIPDAFDATGANPGAPAFADLNVTGVSANIYKVTLTIEGTSCDTTAGSTTVGIDHTYVNDLRITLHSPTGTAIQVIRHTDGDGNNFCQTILDDAGTDGSIQAVSSGQAPFTGSFTPLKPLSGFMGEAADGTWQLEAQDFFFEDTGNIRFFSITITPAVCDVAALSPQPMAVDAQAVTGDSSNHNGVFEPGETVQVSPAWRNTSAAAPQTLSGTGSGFTGPAGPAYTLVDGSASYGTIAAGNTVDCASAGGDCYLMTVTGTRPALHWDATFNEALAPSGVSMPWTLHIGESFPDAPTSNPFYAFIENIFHNGITGGCGGGNYCPGNSVTRAQMAVFLLKAEHGNSFVPPPCTGVFADVECSPTPAFAVDFIEQLAAEGITGGCGGGNYCPNNPVTRAQMAVFLLKAEHGSAYVPPACTGVFLDVECMPTPAFAVNFIEQLAAEGVTGGCGGGNYCPNNPNTRGQMAVFLTKTFGLQLYGP